MRTSRDIELVGGGGTDMTEGIARAVELRPRPDILVVVTDGYTPWPADQPPVGRVVVALLGEATPPAPLPPVWAHTVRVV